MGLFREYLRCSVACKRLLSFSARTNLCCVFDRFVVELTGRFPLSSLDMHACSYARYVEWQASEYG